MAIFTSCMDVIDKPNISTVGDDMWNSEDLVRMYLDELYLNSLPAASWGGNMNQTDEALGTAATAFMYGSASIGTESSYSTTFWHRLRYINLMLDELKNKSSLSDSIQAKYIGQARFLRAIEYWQIVRLYGGIPILDHAIDINKDEDDIARSSTKECVDFIIGDLDYAASVLPNSWQDIDGTTTNFGRLTRLAALAFKGRVLLNFASPMFTERDAYVAYDGSSIDAFDIDNSKPGAKAARWEASYQSNKTAYDQLLAKGYGLNPDLTKVFTTEAVSNPEAVMVRLYTGQNYTHGWEASIRPTSLNGTGHRINPTWELALAFPTIDGKRVTDATSGYQDKFYWVNRDPRFYKTLVYNGMVWDISSTSGRKQWSYLGTNSEASIPLTGFYCCKASDPTLNNNNLAMGKIDWMEIRMAEVLLNLAESAAETNRSSEAITLLRTLRERAGILKGSDASSEYGISNSISKTDLIDLIMNERLVELAFENQRYWDLRRRMMYTRDLSDKTKKLNGTRRRGVDNGPKSSMKTFLLTNKDTLTLTTGNYYNYFLSFYLKKMDTNPNAVHLGINYKQDYYYLPIPDNMFLNSDRLVQTLGWSMGTFDPLAE